MAQVRVEHVLNHVDVHRVEGRRVTPGDGEPDLVELHPCTSARQLLAQARVVFSVGMYPGFKVGVYPDEALGSVALPFHDVQRLAGHDPARAVAADCGVGRCARVLAAARKHLRSCRHGHVTGDLPRAGRPGSEKQPMTMAS